jgi:hypothetical protein
MTGKPVPESATLVVAPTEIGIPSPSDAAGVHHTYHIGCEDEVVTIATDREVIYTEYQCADLPAQLYAVFDPRPIYVQVAPATDGAELTVEFPGERYDLRTGRVWVQPLPPAGAPPSAALLAPGTSLGERDAGTLFYASCHAEGILIATSSFVVQADAPCEQAERLLQYAGRTVEVNVTDGGVLAINTGEAGTVEIPTSRAWAWATPATPP